MTCFVDTSGFIAIAHTADEDHLAAMRVWDTLAKAQYRLITTNYVVVETVALMHHRYGLSAVRTFVENILPVVIIDWVDPKTQEVALETVFSGGRRGPGIVDCVSFHVMRRLGIAEALAFDRHFTEQGYSLPA